VCDVQAMAGAHRFRETWRTAGLRRSVRRALDDTYVLLSLALVVPVLLAEIIADKPQLLVMGLVSASFLSAQVWLARPRIAPVRRLAPRTRSTVRLFLALAFVAIADLVMRDATFRPTALYLPIVAMAAATGSPAAIGFGALATVAFLLPPVLEGADLTATVQRGFVMTAAGVVLVIGTRRTVAALESTLAQLRTSMAAERRRARRSTAIEAVGRVLAAEGASQPALDRVMDLLVGRFGYTYVSIYLSSGSMLRLGAQRGYADPIVEFDGTLGVMGRVMRSREPLLIPNARDDPDFVAAESGLAGEICVPLIAGGELLGVVNVESMHEDELDESDLEAMLLVSDQLASALALARQREDVATQAALFRRLAQFSSAANRAVSAEELYEVIAQSVSTVIAAEAVILVVLDHATDRYLIRAMAGGDPQVVGAEVRPGEGMSGRAMEERHLVVAERLERARFPSAVRDARIPDVVTAVSVPLIFDEAVIGAITLLRERLDLPFSQAEQEVLDLLGNQAALAISKVWLLAEVTEASIRDPLTGLFNRRYLDASIERVSAARARRSPEDRDAVAAILFDLDHFGAFNKRHGHLVGDAVLRRFASILQARFRASDLVARYGGEEFLVVLDQADRNTAKRLAEEVRAELAAARIAAPDGKRLRATVSAGCAELPSHETELKALVRTADVGLAMAKHAGRNLVVAA
jgi:diguanylate cyclase (GGDEF)-like protein